MNSPEKLFIRKQDDFFITSFWYQSRLLFYQKYSTSELAPTKGDIYLGRILSLENSLNAAFIDIGLDQPGFLDLQGYKKPIQRGEFIIVQIIRQAQGQKLIKLSPKIKFTGLSIIYLPEDKILKISKNLKQDSKALPIIDFVTQIKNQNEGLIIRRNAQTLETDFILKEVNKFRDLWQTIQNNKNLSKIGKLFDDGNHMWRILRDQQGFFVDHIIISHRNLISILQKELSFYYSLIEEKILYQPSSHWVPNLTEEQEQLEQALNPYVELDSGKHLIIESNQTLHTIDINAGVAPHHHDKDQYFFKSNIETFAEIALQIRLRNLHGIIIIDTINISPKELKEKMMHIFKKMFENDPSEIWIGHLSALGLIEMTRQYYGPTLKEQLTKICKKCDGLGYTSFEI
ncbi:MAG: ribonuclease E/G [Alphaproteobacteria bacterium]|nr:ribonuclease E/G [Alphaproteobacteria bacterium]